MISQQINHITHSFYLIKRNLILDQKIIASNPIVDNFVTSSKLNYDINARALERLFSKSLSLSKTFKSIYFVDYLGREEVRVDRVTGRMKKYRDLHNRELFGDVESNIPGTVGVDAPFKKDGNIFFSTATNIIDGDIGEFGGALFIDYDFGEFLESLSMIAISEENSVWIFSPDGILLKKPSKNGATFDPLPYMSELINYTPEILELEEGILAYSDLSIIQGQPFIRVAISISSSHILKDIKIIIRFYLIVFLLFTLIIVVAVFYQSKHFTEPIVELSKAASALAEGDLSTKVEVRAVGEVRGLVKSFNKMANDLEASHANIIQRNEELDAANEELAAVNEELDAANEELAATNEELYDMNERLEQRVDERTRELKEAQRMAHIGSWTWDINSGELIWTDEVYRIFGLRPQESPASYEYFISSVHPDDRNYVQNKIDSAIYEEEPYSIEFRLLLPGDVEKVIFTMGEVYYKDDKPVRMAGTIQDITERKKAERDKEDLWSQLLQSQKMETIGLLSGRIAHDFNNMLTPIVGYSSIAYDMLPDDNKAKEMIGRIFNTSKKASNLIDQLLTFSRKQVFEKETCDFGKVLKEMKGLITSMTGEDVELKLFVDKNTNNINGNSMQLQQVVLNLAVNARQAMPEGGTISIRLENFTIDDEYVKTHKDVTKGDYIMLTVEDTGEGMTPEVQMRIFDPFFTTREDEKGSGLGLSTVYGIVKQHDGFIRSYSELGKGSVFRIFFPVSREKVREEKRKRVMEEISEEISVKGTETVLVVDDKKVIVDLVYEMLTPKGYTVLKAVNGKDAIEISMQTEDNIDILMADVVMPGINGWETYNEIKKIKPGIKVLFMSGFIENSVILNDIQNKGMPFIKKPLDPKVVLKEVRKVLDEV